MMTSQYEWIILEWDKKTKQTNKHFIARQFTKTKNWLRISHDQIEFLYVPFQVFHFLSDIGGTLGLFLGASLMSFVEIVQLILEILNYFRNKCSKDKPKVKKKNCTSVEPIEGFKVKIGVTRECWAYFDLNICIMYIVNVFVQVFLY